MVTRQDIRAYVRAYLDLEVEDLADALIDRWTSEGFRRIARYRQMWPGYETVDSFTTTAGVQAYPTTLREVTAIVGPHRELSSVDRTIADVRFFQSTSSHPQSFAVYGGEIRLYPTPAGAFTYTVTGYRAPTLPAGAGDPIDLPHEDAEDVLISYVMHKAYLYEDDPDMAAAHKTQFDEGLALIAKDETNAPTGDPVVLGGSRRRPPIFERLAYPWEV